MTSAHLITQYADAPDVHFFVVEFSLNDLRRNVIESTTEGLPLVEWRINCPAEIAEFQNAKTIENILWLDVSVNDRLTMQML